MNTQIKNSYQPFVVAIFIYFIVGFLMTVNGQFQAPLQNSFLSYTTSLKNTLTTLISFSFFFAFLVCGTTGGKWVNIHGYKGATIRGLVLMLTGLLLFSLSSYIVSTYPIDSYPSLALKIGNELIPYGFFIFLLGSFCAGASVATIQVAITSYIASYKIPNTTAAKRMFIGSSINSVGMVIAPFFVAGVVFSGVQLKDVASSQIVFPMLCLALAVVFIFIFVKIVNIPDIENTRSGDIKLPHSVFSFKHFSLGVIAIFFYVGAETSVGVNCSMHAKALRGVL